MNIDAASMAEQLAYYEVYAAQTRNQERLTLLQSQSSMITKIDSALDSLDNIIYKFTKPSGSFEQSSVSLSSEDYFSVNAAGYAKNINMDIFVEQKATSHQVAVNTSGTEPTDAFVSTGTMDIEFQGETYTINVADADSSGDGTVTYQEFVNYFNQEMDGMVNATLVRSGGEMKLLFSSEETGAENLFSITANTGDAEIDQNISDGNTSPIKSGQDAIIWLGDQGSGVQLTNASNTFENIVPGVDITLTQANEVGSASTNFTIGPDSDETISVLNEFITAYNEVISVLDTATRSGSDSEERGVLASDGSIRGIESKLNGLIRGSYYGVSMFELGLSLDKEGKLELDSDKFKEAQELYDLETIFCGDEGLFKTMETTIEQYADYTSGSLNRQKERISAQQDRVNDNLDRLDAKYDMYYKRYLAQYTQLNTIMNSMDSISSLF